MVVVQDSNLISFSSTQLTTFQTVFLHVAIIARFGKKVNRYSYVLLMNDIENRFDVAVTTAVADSMKYDKKRKAA